MLLRNKSDEEESKWDKYWAFAKSYVKNVFNVYLDFVGPALLIMVASQVFDDVDKERFGLGWLYVTSLKDDRAREEKFPAYEPGTSLERRRMEAANAVDYAVKTV